MNCRVGEGERSPGEARLLLEVRAHVDPAVLKELVDRVEIKGNDEDRVRALFSDPKIRQMIHAQPDIRLEVKDSEGWFGPKFPEDVDELHFQVVGVINDVDRLKALFDLFAAVLDHLCKIGSACKQDAAVEL